jgi:hypothetical protein
VLHGVSKYEGDQIKDDEIGRVMYVALLQGNLMETDHLGRLKNRLKDLTGIEWDGIYEVGFRTGTNGRLL